MAVRGILKNPDRVLLPGYFVRVRVPFEQQQNALLVPDAALGSDQAGRYVLVVNAENVVEQRKVTTGQLDGELRVIESGLKPDDKVVVGRIAARDPRPEGRSASQEDRVRHGGREVGAGP